jgi:cytidine deaminase
MFQAHAAGLRSAELGRQVGAAITTREGALVATGTNEVAKRGGGLYWEDDPLDDRDFKRGEDTNEVRRMRVAEELLIRMKEEGWLRPEYADVPVDQFLAVFDDTRLAGLIEFGRAVHAEMAALTDAAMRGVGVRSCTLYTTTFPCHLCARHIVAAGIERLVYIHPYPKSLAAQLYEDSIAVDQAHPPGHVISFQPFVGVAPNRFLYLFAAGTRKLDGKVVEFVRSSATPKFTDRPFAHLAYMLREQLAAKEFETALVESGIKAAPSDA